MRRFPLFIFIILSAISLTLFQNCAKTTDDTAAQISDQATAIGQLKVASSVQLSQENLPGARESVRADRSVNPIGLDFGPISNDFTYLFPYHLNLASGEIINRSNNTMISRLTDQENADLAFIMDNSILANRRDYVDPNTLCATVMIQGYANLQTDQGDVIVGAGTSSCDIVDLFKDDESGQTAGLKEWLTDLQNRLPQ